MAGGQVHIDHFLPLAERHFLNHRRARDAGAIHQAMHGAETRHRIGDALRAKGFIADIAFNGHGVITRQVFRHLHQGFAVAFHHHQIAAKPQHQFGYGAANTLPRASYDDGLACECHRIHHCRFLPYLVCKNYALNSTAARESTPGLAWRHRVQRA